MTTARTGRPVSDPDLISVGIPERGLHALWDPQREKFIGDVEIVRWASLYAATGHHYSDPITLKQVTCGTDSPRAILASLLAACGGRGVVLGGRSLREMAG